MCIRDRRSALTQYWAANPAGEHQSFGSAWGHLAQLGADSWKPAAINLLSLGAGKAALPLAEAAARPLLSAAATKVSGIGAELGGYYAASTIMGSALDGQMPSGSDWAVNAVMTFGMVGASHLVHHVGATGRPVATPAGEEYKTCLLYTSRCV